MRRSLSPCGVSTREQACAFSRPRRMHGMRRLRKELRAGSYSCTVGYRVRSGRAVRFACGHGADLRVFGQKKLIRIIIPKATIMAIIAHDAGHRPVDSTGVPALHYPRYIDLIAPHVPGSTPCGEPHTHRLRSRKCSPELQVRPLTGLRWHAESSPADELFHMNQQDGFPPYPTTDTHPSVRLQQESSAAS